MMGPEEHMLTTASNDPETLVVGTPPITGRGLFNLFQTCHRSLFLCDKRGLWGVGGVGLG